MTKNKQASEAAVREIRRRTRRKFSPEEKIRIVLEGLRGEQSVAELCRREGIVANGRVNTDLLVAGVEDEVLNLIKGPVTPGFQFFIEQFGGPGDLATGDFETAQLGGDFGYFASGNALNVHFGDG